MIYSTHAWGAKSKQILLLINFCTSEHASTGKKKKERENAPSLDQFLYDPSKHRRSRKIDRTQPLVAAVQSKWRPPQGRWTLAILRLIHTMLNQRGRNFICKGICLKIYSFVEQSSARHVIKMFGLDFEQLFDDCIGGIWSQSKHQPCSP